MLFSVPYGNYSYIKVVAEDKDLPLYGSGGFRLIWDTKFDAGLSDMFSWITNNISQLFVRIFNIKNCKLLIAKFITVFGDTSRF